MGAGAVDALVIGGGIAGVAVAAELSRDRTVVLLEMEAALAQHTTGRSAAVWINGYGGPSVYPFAAASRAWFENRGEGRVEHDLTRLRGMLVVAERPEDSAGLTDYVDNGAAHVAVDEAIGHFGALRREVVHAAVWDESVRDLDVPGALEAFRRTLRANGGSITLRAGVTSIERGDGEWRVASGTGSYRTPLVVDAAGAWADEVAQLAGLPPLGLMALRRTMCTFDRPPDLDSAGWPLLLDAAERFYMKPEGAGFIASPADAVQQPPADARPRMDDVATALDLVARFTTLPVRTIRSAWAGLRTFAPDRSMVLGPDPAADGFAWSAGFGGFGIMAAPAAARAVVSLIDVGLLPDDIVAAGGNVEMVSPARLRG